VLVRPADQATTKSHLEAFQFKYQAGARHLGSFLGDEGERDAWLTAKIDTWISAVRTLGKMAKRYPQMSYTGMARSLQMEGQYTLRTIPDVEALFEPLAQVIEAEYLPALLSEPAGLPECLRERLTLPARWSGLGILDPYLIAN
jgi:DNA-binding phage protein